MKLFYLFLLLFSHVVILHAQVVWNDNATDTNMTNMTASNTENSSENPDTLKKGKIGVIVAVFFVTFGASFLPWWMDRKKHALLAINFGSCFAGGIVVGLALCHLFKDASEAFSDYFTLAGPSGLWYPENTDYPFAGLIAGSVLLILMLVENIASTHAHVHDLHSEEDDHDHKHEHTHEHEHVHGEPDHHDHVHGDHEHSVSHERHSHDQHENHPETMYYHQDCQLPSQTRSFEPENSNNLNCVTNMVQTMQATSNCGDITAGEVRMISSRYGPNNCICIEPEVCPPELCSRNQQGGESSSGSKEVVRGTREQVIRAWTFFAAMSVHSIFDGLAIGAESKPTQFIMFVLAIIIHKFFDGFVVGVALYLGRLSWVHTISGLLFCASMTPVGIGIGWAITDGATGAAARLTTGIIFSISFGTFLFISLVELLPQGLADSRYRPLKLLLAMVGFGIMAIIAIWT